MALWACAAVLLLGAPMCAPATARAAAETGPKTGPEPAAAVISNLTTLPTADDGRFDRIMLAWNPAHRGDGWQPRDQYVSSMHFGAPRAIGAPFGRVSSRFGWRADPMGLGLRLHAGIDIPGKQGSLVSATAPGAVAFAGWAGGYGNMVVIDHGGGVRTRYGHLVRALVTAGERVNGGDVIGLLGSTGHSTGPHLHYELRVNGAPVDPLLPHWHAALFSNRLVTHGLEPEPELFTAQPRSAWTTSSGGLPQAVIN